MDRTRLTKLIKFLAAGLPSFILAVPLNKILVERLIWHTEVAYALVLVVQVTINFFLCRFFVFEKRSNASLFKEFTAFFSGIALFRLADWAVYTLLVNVFGFYYLAIQLLNVVLFSVLKFAFSEKTLT